MSPPSLAIASDGIREYPDTPVRDDLTRSFLRIAVGLSLAGSLAYEAALVVNGQGLAPRAIGLLTFVLIVAAAAWLLMRERLRAAALTLGAGVWANLIASSFFFGGVNSPSGYMYPIIIFLAGWQFGPAVAYWIAGLTAAALGALALGEAGGYLPAPPPTSPSMRWVIEAFVFCCCAILVAHIVRNYRARLAEVRQLTGDLARRTAALELSEADLRRAQAVAQVGSWVYDMQADVMHLSDETCRIFGVPPGVKGNREIYLGRAHPEDRDAVARAWQIAFEGAAPFDHEHRIRVGSAVRWVRQKAEFERDADGRVTRAVGTTQDMTERRRREDDLARARNQLAATLDAIPDLLFEIDAEGRFLDYRAPRADLLAVPPEVFMGRTLRETLPDAVAEVSHAALAEALATGHSHGRIFELHLPVGRRWFELSVARKPVAPGETARLIAISRDITERKEAEEEIRGFNATLERRVNERTTELQETNRELESFSYTISHDLRAPLRAIIGFASLLEDSLGERLDEQSRAHVARIVAGGERMGRLIDRVLQYSRISRSAPMPIELDLDVLAREVVDDLRAHYPASAITVGPLGRVEADPVMLRQILHNLVDNALKYSARAAQPRVELARLPDGSGYFVRDNGVGFDMQHAGHLFDLFSSLNSDPAYESTGAGLAIARRLLQRHSGWIRAEAAPGAGATFSFGLWRFGTPPAAA